MLATALGIAIPVLAAGNTPYDSPPGDGPCRACRPVCLLPAATWCDGRPVYVFVPGLPQPAPIPRGRIEPPDRGVCVTLPGQPCPRPPRVVR